MRIFYILLTFTLLSAVTAKSQSRLSTSQDTEVKIIKCYPNPAISVITFDFQKAFDKSYSFQIFNFLGKKVYESPAGDQKTLVNLTDYFRGVYIFQLKDQFGKVVETGKFQVAK